MPATNQPNARTRREFLRVLGGAAAAGAVLAGGPALLAACGGGPTQPRQGVKKGGHVVEGITSDPATFNPIYITATSSAVAGYTVFSKLLESDKNGTIIPSIAKSVPRPESDGLTYRLEMRQDALWSDGQPLTADDAVFAFNLLHGSTYDIKAIAAPGYTDLQPYIDSVTAADRYTVVFKTKVPYAPFLSEVVATYSPLPKHILDPIARSNPHDFKANPFNLAPTVASGPFTLDHYDKGQQIVYKANPKHFLGRPNLDSYVLKIVDSSISVANQLKTGELDVGTIDPSLWDSLATAANVGRLSFATAQWDYFGYNMDPTNPKRPASGKIFGDPASGKAVRQALYHAVDRQKLVQKVYFNLAEVANSIEPQVSWSYNPKVKQYAYDVKLANDMLEQAGWKKGPDGIRVKDGVRLSFQVTLSDASSTHGTLVQALVEGWRQLGVDATPHPVPAVERNNAFNDRDFDVMLIGELQDVDPDSDLPSLFDSRDLDNGGDNFGYRNPQVDDLFDRAARTLDQSKRKDLYGQIQSTLADDLPMAALAWPKNLWGISKRVQGFDLGPFNRYGGRPWLKDVWVTDGR